MTGKITPPVSDDERKETGEVAASKSTGPAEIFTPSICFTISMQMLVGFFWYIDTYGANSNDDDAGEAADLVIEFYTLLATAIFVPVCIISWIIRHRNKPLAKTALFTKILIIEFFPIITHRGRMCLRFFGLLLMGFH